MFNYNILLKSLIISDKPLTKADLFLLKDLNYIRKKYKKYSITEIEDLRPFKDKFWIWSGTYDNKKPVFGKKRVVRLLYSNLRYPLKYSWRVQPKDEKTPFWEVNPYKFKLANKFEDYGPVDAGDQEMNDIIELLSNIDSSICLNEVCKILKYYDRNKVEQAYKILRRSK